MKPANILSPAERDERDQLTAIVKSGIRSFVEVGNALLTIADKRLYRETHGSFEEYCQAEYAMSARHAYRYCEAAKVVKTLPENCDQLVTNEAQARELAKVPADKRVEVLKKAGDKPTARKIREAAIVDVKPESETISAAGSAIETPRASASSPTHQPTPAADAAESEGGGSISVLKGINMAKVLSEPEHPAFAGIDVSQLSQVAKELLINAYITRGDMEGIISCINGDNCDVDTLGEVLGSLFNTKKALVAYQLEIKRK